LRQVVIQAPATRSFAEIERRQPFQPKLGFGAAATISLINS